MAGLRITESELRRIVVDELELVSGTEFDRARAMTARLGIPLEHALVERGQLPYGFLIKQLASAWGVRYVDLKLSDIDPAVLRLLKEEYAREHKVIPFAKRDRTVSIAMVDPRDRTRIDEISRLTGSKVEPCLATEENVLRALLLYKGDLRRLLERAATEVSPSKVSAGAGEGGESAVDLVNRLLEYAAATKASDIHIEPYEFETIVRYRVDGILREVLSLPAASHQSLVARVKILAGLRIDERRVPQDGRFESAVGGVRMDLRVSSLATQWGEKIVLRVLAKSQRPPELEELGLDERDLQTLAANMSRPHGLILITGPTGSGKSTTLYGMVARLAAERNNTVNLSTVEDPIEHTIARVNQIPINPAAGVHFATALRALLRQDPDIIMLGEIRDLETAQVAVRSALVGRLLLSTLHTNDATGAVARLLDMGVEPFLLASTLNLVVAQRLVRRICPACRETLEEGASELLALRSRPDFGEVLESLRRHGAVGSGAQAIEHLRLFRGRGCAHCSGTGFSGRIGMFELYVVGDEERKMIVERRDTAVIRNAARAKGMRTMFEDGLAKAFMGETTLDEILRVAV
jgi:type IV pilus assembly protein PilB